MFSNRQRERFTPGSRAGEPHRIEMLKFEIK